MKRIFTFLFLFTFITFSQPLFTFTVHAEDKNVKEWIEDKGSSANSKESTPAKVEVAPDKVTFFDYINMIFALVFVIGLLYLLLQVINSRNKLNSNQEYMQNLGGIHVGSSKSIQMIRVGNQVMVVGVGDSVQLLKEIDDEQEVSELLENYNKKMENMFQANSIMEKAFQMKNKFLNAKQQEQTTDFKTQFLEQMESMKMKRSHIVNRYKDESKDNEL